MERNSVTECPAVGQAATYQPPERPSTVPGKTNGAHYTPPPPKTYSYSAALATAYVSNRVFNLTSTL